MLLTFMEISDGEVVYEKSLEKVFKGEEDYQ